MTKYLGIDYGTAHIGLATSEHMLATPLPSIHNDPTIFSRLKSIISSEGITSVVCGIPEGVLAHQVTIFAQKLEIATGLPVILHPETLSTKSAVTRLRESGASLKKLKNDHVYAACLILEDYLELHSSVLY
ncbi:MAG: Holliday junction resolvase RuvX [bacterium]